MCSEMRITSCILPDPDIFALHKKIIGAGGFNKGLKDGKKDEKDEADKPV